MKRNRILLTGGLGYIGSHTAVKLLEIGFEVTVIDNLCNSKLEVKNRIEKITSKQLNLVTGDIRDKELLNRTFKSSNFDSVIHFAGLKAVGESKDKPLSYYENNVAGSINLLEAMIDSNVNRIVFSSSATVYGDPGFSECKEDTELNPKSVYGQTKYFVEQIIQATAKANSEFKYVNLRYFNPVGAHSSGLIGEDPNGIPNNLVPFIAQVAVGRREKLMIWGNDYPTPDGTGKRDYIHVDDLASGHLASLEYLNSGKNSITLNLGTGKSHSVLEMLRAFESVSGKSIPFEIASRREGDVAENFANADLARKTLGWTTKYDLLRMCEDTWRWQSSNPDGYC